MATASVETERKTTLILTQEESYWLMGVLQNPLHGESPTEEDAQSARIRKEIFTAINK